MHQITRKSIREGSYHPKIAQESVTISHATQCKRHNQATQNAGASRIDRYFQYGKQNKGEIMRKVCDNKKSWMGKMVSFQL